MDDNSWICKRTVPHPLLIDHIAEKILEYYGQSCSSCYLQTRLVCHQWNIISSQALQNQSQGVISFGKFFHSITSMQDLFKTLQQSIIFPFVNFRLCQDVFQPSNEPLIKEFFSKCSPILTFLVIRLDQESTLNISGEWLSDLTLPRLKTLVFDDRREGAKAFDEHLLKLLLCASSNNLETLSLHRQQLEWTVENEGETEDQNMKLRLCKTLSEVSLLNLKNLQIDLELCDELLKSLSLNVKGLQNLTICLKTSNFLPDSLYSFLDVQSNTLTKLKLAGLCKKSNFEIKFPRLESLLCLEVHGWCSVCPDVKFGPFTYAHNFPKLSTLLLNTWLDESTWFQFLSDNVNFSSVGSLKKLKLPQELLNPELIQAIRFSFHNLKSLELHYTEDSVGLFEKVFCSLVQLEELKIHQNRKEFRSNQNLDSLLTGFTARECRRMLHKKDFGQTAAFRTISSSKTGLTNLKKLKVLDMIDVLKYQTFITDVSGYVVFLEMKNLKRLKISRSQIQPECLRLLASKFPEDLQSEMQSVQKSISKDAKYQVSMNNCVIY